MTDKTTLPKDSLREASLDKLIAAYGDINIVRAVWDSIEHGNDETVAIVGVIKQLHVLSDAIHKRLKHDYDTKLHELRTEFKEALAGLAVKNPA